MTLQEAEEFYANYKKALPTLFAWQERMQRKCKRENVVHTYFGRPRRLKHYFTHGQVAFGYRTILNDPIQGTAGDILKITMCKLWKKLLNHPDYRDDVRFLNTVHDEINYSVRISRAAEIGKLIQDTMDFNIPEWPVPIISELSYGWSWGQQFNYYRDKNDEWRPKLEIKY